MVANGSWSIIEVLGGLMAYSAVEEYALCPKVLKEILSTTALFGTIAVGEYVREKITHHVLPEIEDDNICEEEEIGS